MCLGVPMRIIESDGFIAVCERRGERRRVNVMLIEEARVGARVLVHINNAVRLLDEEEARLIDEALDELASALGRQAYPSSCPSPARGEGTPFSAGTPAPSPLVGEGGGEGGVSR